MKPEALDTHQKALQINLDAAAYGSFTESGVGQDVARWFSRAGGVACTIAKAVSTYDAATDDATSGSREGHASQQRLNTLLDHEYQLLLQQFDAERGCETAFFAFASAVGAVTNRSHVQSGESQGWLGIRFQSRPRAEPSQIVVHVRLLDRHQGLEQEVLGVLGVNLIYGARHYQTDPEAIILSLLDNLVAARVELDFVEFSGPQFAGVNNRVLNLQLVEHGLASTAMLNDSGEAVPRDNTTTRVHRGSARPPARGTKPVRGGLIDSVHLAGVPKAA